MDFEVLVDIADSDTAQDFWLQKKKRNYRRNSIKSYI